MISVAVFGVVFLADNVLLAAPYSETGWDQGQETLTPGPDLG